MSQQSESDNMPSPEDMFALFRRIDDAFRGDDIEALRVALDNPADFPNTLLPKPLELGDHILHYAIFTSSLQFIGNLIGAGINLKYESEDRVPPLFSAILSERDERTEIMSLLLDNGADIMQLGYSDWTALHLAVNMRDIDVINLLLAHGADPHWRAGEDDSDVSALDDALAMEYDAGVEAMLGSGN